MAINGSNSRFRKNGTWYNAINSPDATDDNERVDLLIEDNGRFKYSTDYGATYKSATQNEVIDLGTIKEGEFDITEDKVLAMFEVFPLPIAFTWSNYKGNMYRVDMGGNMVYYASHLKLQGTDYIYRISIDKDTNKGVFNRTEDKNIVDGGTQALTNGVKWKVDRNEAKKTNVLALVVEDTTSNTLRFFDKDTIAVDRSFYSFHQIKGNDICTIVVDSSNFEATYTELSLTTKTEFDTETSRLDALIDDLDATKADAANVQQNTNNIATLGADKQNFAIDKYEGNLPVSTMEEFRTHFYELRKSPTRTFQFEVSSSTNIDLMDILGWPDGNGKSAFIYVTMPYSEAGGFELDIKYMGRNGSPIYNRVMSGTLDANWKDTGWTQDITKDEMNSLSMVPSDTIENIFTTYPTNPVPQTLKYTAPSNGMFSISKRFRTGLAIEIGISRFTYYLSSTAGDYSSLCVPVKKGDVIRFTTYGNVSSENIATFNAIFTHAKEV